MFEKLLSKPDRFYALFEKAADLAVSAAELMEQVLAPGADVADLVKKIKAVEHEADSVTHETIEQIHKTFVTPIDRDDIHALICRIDDVIDMTDAVAQRIEMYDLKDGPPSARDLASVLTSATKEVRRAVAGLRDLKHPQALLASCVEINRIENEGDAALRAGLAKLFREEQDLRKVMMWKEVYEFLESAVDRCEDVANVVEGVVLQHA